MSTVVLSVDERIGKTDDFVTIFPNHKYEMIKRLQIKIALLRTLIIIEYMKELLEDETEKSKTYFCVSANKGSGAKSITELYKKKFILLWSQQRIRHIAETHLPIGKLLNYRHGIREKSLLKLA